MSDTPETDALRDRWNSDELIHVEDIFDLAESLERERNEYKDLLIRVWDDLFVLHNGEAVHDLKVLIGAIQLTDALTVRKEARSE